MSPSMPLLAAATCALLPALVLVPAIRAGSARRDAVRRRLAQVRRGAARPGEAAAHATGHPSPSWLRLAGAVGAALARSGLLPAATLRELRDKLGNTPLAGTNGVAVFVGLKALAAVSGLLVALLLSRVLHPAPVLRLALPAMGGVSGMLLPDWVLRRGRRAYLARVEAGLPDALDMLVICSEAGLALEPGIERVSVELGPAHPAAAREFGLTAQEMRLIADRAQVLANLGARTGIEDLRRLGATLIQTIQFGTPVTQALRTLAAEMRRDAMTRYEARAARLPVLLTLPMILFILPCVFLIAGGPAAIQVMATLGKN